MRLKRGKEKLEEEQSLFSEFRRSSLTEIIATQPLLRDSFFGQEFEICSFTNKSLMDFAVFSV